jgi:RimJ/RimL family protein N-acetyltransferase
VKVIVTDNPNFFGEWWAMKMRETGERCTWIPGSASVIGLLDLEKGPVAACIYDRYNGKSLQVHIAAEGKSWLNREYLWFCFYYPFVQLGVHKLIGTVDSSNLDAVRWNEHLGYTLEATLKDACPNGDLRVYTMTREQCKWLSLKKDKSLVEARSASTA